MKVATKKPDLAKLLAGAQLPALPQSAVRLLELSQNPSNGPDVFALPIEADPGLTGQVLRFVNSSYFGFAQEISSVKLAITLVGMRTVKNFALWSAVFSVMPKAKGGLFDLRSLWQDSLRRAIFARRLGRLLKVANADDLFAGALLQDMAIPLLVKELPQEYHRLLADRAARPGRLSDLERETFGWTHAQAAGTMARGWGLPERFVDLVQHHTAPQSAPPDLGQPIVALSARLPTCVDEEWSERAAFLAEYPRLGGAAAPSPREIFARVDEEFAEFAPVLKVAAPARPLAEYWPA